MATKFFTRAVYNIVLICARIPSRLYSKSGMYEIIFMYEKLHSLNSLVSSIIVEKTNLNF
nr:MAG TPA: hypothetical protein [Caudoviricetes sp.]